MVEWTDFGNLSAGQRTLAAEYETLGEERNMPAPLETHTMRQAVLADRFCRELISKLGKVQRYAHHVMDYHERANAKAFRDAASTP